MARGIASMFGPDAMGRGDTLLQLIISDYLAYYGPTTRMRSKWRVGCSQGDDSPLRLALLFLPRLVHNPSLHATLLLRLAVRSPNFTLGLWRTVLISKHAIDISRRMDIGPGLLLPHPVGIGFGNSVRIGRDVTILHYVTMGADTALGGSHGSSEAGQQWCPIIGDDVVIYTQSILVGPISVGHGAVIGAGAWVDCDVRPRAVHPGRAALFRQFAAAARSGPAPSGTAPGQEATKTAPRRFAS